MAILVLMGAFTFTSAETQAQCYPGLSCPETGAPQASPAVERPYSPNEDCSLDGRIRYCVSSVLAAQGKNSYRAANLIDGNSETAWVEGRSDDGLGEWIVIDFTQPQTLGSVRLQNGYTKNADIYDKNGRVRDIEIILSNGQTLRQTLKDSDATQTIRLERAQQIRWLQLKIISVYPGRKYRDTAISELRVQSE
jgi:hypothetical protein